MLPMNIGGGPVGGRRRKAKRKPSAYNKFVGAQMKKGATMKQAAAAWRKKRGGRGGALLGGALLGGRKKGKKKQENTQGDYMAHLNQAYMAKEAGVVDPYIEAWKGSELVKARRQAKAKDFQLGDLKKELRKEQSLFNKNLNKQVKAIEEAHRMGDFERAQTLMEEMEKAQKASFTKLGISDGFAKRYPALQRYYS